MAEIQIFLLAFFFSFLGSIPPGTLNLTILQLGLDNKIKVAWRFALAASIIEYPYAWIAVGFEDIITSSPFIIENIKLIAAIVMVVIGGLNLWSAKNPTDLSRRFQASGFRRGIFLGVLNPLAIPFWIGITAYLKSQGLVTLNENSYLHSYLIGVTLGALVLLMVLAYLARQMVTVFQPNSRVKLVPGILLIALGIYAFIRYLF